MIPRGRNSQGATTLRNQKNPEMVASPGMARGMAMVRTIGGGTGRKATEVTGLDSRTTGQAGTRMIGGDRDRRRASRICPAETPFRSWADITHKGPM